MSMRTFPEKFNRKESSTLDVESTASHTRVQIAKLQKVTSVGNSLRLKEISQAVLGNSPLAIKNVLSPA